MPDSSSSITRADCPSGWLALKKLMWLVSTRRSRMPSAGDERDRDRRRRGRVRDAASRTSRSARIGSTRYLSCGVSRRLRLHQAQHRRHEHERDHEVDHDPDRRPDAERPDRDDVARGERQHAERRRRAGAEQRRRQVRDRRLERCLRRLVAALLVPVLHDVHVVGDREHDDQRDEHAGEHVVAVAEQRVEPERPQHADADRDDRQQHLAPRAERQVDGEQRDDEDRRRERALVVERDAVVGLADLEAAVVVRLHARRAAADRRGRGSAG